MTRPVNEHMVASYARQLIANALHGEAKAITRAIVDDDDAVFMAIDDVEALLVGFLTAAVTSIAETPTDRMAKILGAPFVRNAPAKGEG